MAEEGSGARHHRKNRSHRSRSARECKSHCHDAFEESQTFRIDHFSAKRPRKTFSAAIRECDFRTALEYALHIISNYGGGNAWVKHAGYYEEPGRCRHGAKSLLQLLCWWAMELQPILRADSIRDEKVKVIRALRRIVDRKCEACRARSIQRRRDRGQPVRYRQKKCRSKVDDETYVHCALTSTIGAGRCACLHRSANGCRNRPRDFRPFQKSSGILFNKETVKIDQTSRDSIQPDEDSLRMLAKFREPVCESNVKMIFIMALPLGKPAEAYETLTP